MLLSVAIGFVLLIAPLGLECTMVSTIEIETDSNDTVLFKPINKVDTFHVPLAKLPIISWMDIKHGIYPNIYPIKSQIKVGEPLTVLIYISDANKMYDAIAKDCYAYDQSSINNSTSTIHLSLTEENTAKTKKLSTWTKVNNKNESIILLHTNFNAFRFPDTNRVYLTCNIQLCYQRCKEKKANTIPTEKSVL